MRSRFALLLSLLVVGFGTVGITPPAQAADDAFAYWLYYTVEDGAFSYQESEGPATNVPEDGEIEAYRYAAAVFPPTQEPRADLSDLDFETICGDATAGDGEKRVAVLLDYGLDADATNGDDVPAPTADCAVVPEKATGLQVLDSVGETRLGDKNSLCAINGYPGTGCFEPAKQESAKDGDPVEFTVAGAGDDSSSDKADEDSNNGILIGGAVVVIVALGVGGVLLNRRRSA